MSIVGVVGLPGSGKTYLGVRWVLRSRRRDPGLRVVANIPVVLPWGPPAELVQDWGEVFELRDCVLLLDELQLWLPARGWARHGAEFAEWVSQLRKRRVALLWTSQDLEGVDALVRRRTELVYRMESFRRLGFFYYTAFWGSRLNRVYLRGVVVFNPVVAACYDTRYEIRGL